VRSVQLQKGWDALRQHGLVLGYTFRKAVVMLALPCLGDNARQSIPLERQPKYVSDMIKNTSNLCTKESKTKRKHLLASSFVGIASIC
jgi:hypothetical protein